MTPTEMHIDALTERIALLEEKLKTAEKALKFYTDPHNWDEYEIKEGVRFFTLIKYDCYPPSYNDELFGGRHASEALLKIT